MRRKILRFRNNKRQFDRVTYKCKQGNWSQIYLFSERLMKCVTISLLSHFIIVSHWNRRKISIHHIQSLTYFHVYHLYFQDCLAEGRSVSLPASAVGASKLAVTAVGAYARIRKQFRVPIAEMGGVQVLHWLHSFTSQFTSQRRYILYSSCPSHQFLFYSLLPHVSLSLY